MSVVTSVSLGLVVACLLGAGLGLLWLPVRQEGVRALEHLASEGVTQTTSVAGARAAQSDKTSSGTSRGTDHEQVSAGVLVELVASMLDAGVPVDRSLVVLGQSIEGPAGLALRTVGAGLSLGLPWRQAWAAAPSPPVSVLDLRSALTFAAVSGAPSSSALRAASAQVRRAEHRRAEAAAEKLAVHLVVPLGLCSLPAFIAWGIVPVLIGLVPDFFG